MTLAGATTAGNDRPVTVVIAAIDARATVGESLGRFVEETGSQGRVILVDASRDGTADEAERLHAGMRILRRPFGTLAPELWRDGLAEVETPLVAFSTAQMVPRPGWIEALRRRLEASGAAGVGGAIDPGPNLSPSDQAIYLLRYVSYLEPMPETNRIEPPGDNALYRRDALRGLQPLWERGFWEVEIHRGLREQGERLDVAGDAAVEFHGGSPFDVVVRQRREHARRYGAARAAGMGAFERLTRSVAAPMVPAVMLHRIAQALAARGRSVLPWRRSLPALARLLAAWTAGEVEGFWSAVPAPHGRLEVSRSLDSNRLERVA